MLFQLNAKDLRFAHATGPEYKIPSELMLLKFS